MTIIRDSLIEGIRVRRELLDHEPAILAAAELMRDAVLAGHKVLLCGNGGSASDAQHISAELVGRFVIERRPLPAIALNTDTSALTAIGNDYGYEHVFSRQVEALGAAGDVLVAITTSGTSKNIVAAVAAARARGMKVIGLTGGHAKAAAFVASCDVGLAVPSTVTARIQELHITIGHILCEVLDEAFAPARTAHGANGTNGTRKDDKRFALPELVTWREAQRARGKTVVWTNGVFDLLHVGHLASLREAKKFGDLLVVGINSDASVKQNKGPDRPIFPANERVEMLSALELVDAVLVFDDATPEHVLAQLKPDVHVKGADYANKPIPERAIVEAYGGRIELIRLVPGRSSTSTLSKLLGQ